ncbi:shikimate dehydrogenase [Vibrio sp. S9_S30]|uniref:shikimate dehydrogenase family protein n=1 Tax=Vibrio sp. S9_S30 TaxID=2720226 RepID=UPI00168060CC|nr:shikimate dehydrogenase [Vibrio sp. S9_S30]MBD1556341.1 shikimate dehydrogenase [Vibrio sp. S9_S30]
MNLVPANKPTFYFIGVSTLQSSIMTVFPAWAEFLGLGDVQIRGIDLPLNAPAEQYQLVTSFIKHDPLSLGALVTTHKIHLYQACVDLFDEVDPHARKMHETSCLYKREANFCCSAKDPITSGFALEYIVPPHFFSTHRGNVFVMGAGGSATAIIWFLSHAEKQKDRPAKVVVSDVSQCRLDELDKVLKRYGVDVECEYVLVSTDSTNDEALASLPPYSLVINATGLGKDAPGSPLSQTAQFPRHSVVWELNYRGELEFYQQAKAQEARSHLSIHDGWVYFLYGWTRVMADVFDVDIPVKGERFEAMSRIAARSGKPLSHKSGSDEER